MKSHFSLCEVRESFKEMTSSWSLKENCKETKDNGELAKKQGQEGPWDFLVGGEESIFCYAIIYWCTEEKRRKKTEHWLTHGR